MTGHRADALTRNPYGDRDTSSRIAAHIANESAATAALISSRKPRLPRLPIIARLLHRGSREAAPQPQADQTGTFTRLAAAHQSPEPWPEGVLDRDVPEAAHENADPEPTMAIAPEDLAHDLITHATRDARPYAPAAVAPPATSWAEWDGQPGHPEPMHPAPECRCDECKYGRRPGKDVVLYTGPGAVDMLVEQALRDGRYEDVEASADAAWMKVHEPAVRVIRRINRRFGPVQGSIYSALHYEPSARTSPKLAEGLHRMEAVLEERLTEMRHAAAKREAELDREAGSMAAAGADVTA